MKSKPTIGILGAGKLGTILGKLFVNADYKVLIAGSKDPDSISLTIEVLVPGAIPLTKEDVTKQADIIILALPLSKYKSIPTQNLPNKIVIDAMNYWWETDGLDRIPSDPNLSSSEMIQDYIKEAIIIKAFNHMGYHDLETESFSDKRKVIALAGDNEEAKTTVEDLISNVGFQPLDLGSLKKGIVLEPGSELFGANLPKDDFIKTLQKIV